MLRIRLVLCSRSLLQCRRAFKPPSHHWLRQQFNSTAVLVETRPHWGLARLPIALKYQVSLLFYLRLRLHHLAHWRWPLAARIKALATHKVCHLRLFLFLPLVFSAHLTKRVKVQYLPATVSSLSAPISSVATSPTNSSALHPILEQPFVVGPGYSPIPYKVVATIVAGKYLNLADLLHDNNARPDNHELQLFFVGRLALAAPRRVNKRQITDLVDWIEALSIYTLILISYFPHRWRDLTAYKLLIIRTYRQFAGRAWLNNDKAFREHVAAARVTDWSSLNVQLYNFHTAGSQVRTPGPRQSSDEPTGFSSSMIVCKSWNQLRPLRRAFYPVSV